MTESPVIVRERKCIYKVKRSCKDIDLRNPDTLEPWVWDCIMRHISRWDFKSLVCSVGGISEADYTVSISTRNFAALRSASMSIAREAAHRIARRDLELKSVSYRNRTDNSSFKMRLIGRESAMQQVFDHIAYGASMPIFKRRIVREQVSSIKGRGQIVGTKVIEKWIKKDSLAAEWAREHKVRYTQKCKYIARGVDAEQCYASGRLEVFMWLFRKDCGNDDLIWLWETLLTSHRQYVNGELYEGFMIGALPSQWAMQYMMSFVYRHLMGLKRTRRGRAVKLVHKALIYMDDIFICGANKKDLRTAILEAERYAKEELGLSLKKHWSICRLDKTPVDMMGYVINETGGVAVRPRVFLRVRRLALRYIRRSRPLTLRLAKRACSYKGYFIQNPKRRIKLNLKVQKAIDSLHLFKLFKTSAEIVSREQRRKNHGCLFQFGTCGNTVYGTA